MGTHAAEPPPGEPPAEEFHRRARQVRPRRRGRTLLVLALAGSLLGGGLYAAVNFIGLGDQLVREKCTAVVASERYKLSPDQASNAALIAAVAIERGLPERAASIAIATAMQESKLTNIDYGDRAGPDSRGLFQQRPSMGWGTEQQVQNPGYAANRFFQELETFDYSAMPLTEAAQRVQRSAYPQAYAKHEAMAKAFSAPLTGNAASTLNCTLRPAESAGSPEAVAVALGKSTGIRDVVVEGSRIQVPVEGKQGWAVAQWSVANAAKLDLESVSYAGLAWDRSHGSWDSADSTDGYVIIAVSKP